MSDDGCEKDGSTKHEVKILRVSARSAGNKKHEENKKYEKA
jgi:hypothetical protein